MINDGVLSMMVTPGSGASPIRVACAGRSELVRRGLRATLEKAPHMALIGEAATPAGVEKLIVTHSPQVLVIEMELGLDIRSLLCRVKTAAPAIKIMILLDIEDKLPPWDCLVPGIEGIVLSTQPPSVLLATIEQMSGWTAAGKEAGSSCNEKILPTPAVVNRHLA
jgi:DNA-binding NarL/FixJ family response regulator